MSKAPEVTAVITTHSRPLLVREAVASVRAETYPDAEIVVVDDGGGIHFDPPVRVVRGGDLGVAGARNLGLSAARGEYVIFLDDDDVAFPNRIASLLNAAREHDASLCFGMTRRIVGDTKEVLESVPTHVRAYGAVGFDDILACTPHVNSILLRTEALREVGGFDAKAKHFDDWAAWLRIADRYTIRSIPDVVAEWRLHTQGLSGALYEQRAMKNRLLALFDHLKGSLSQENARAVGAAHALVASVDIVTYDDYADAMAQWGGGAPPPR
jgi:glycosyltransferase involved in cell wall biosynthesis